MSLSRRSRGTILASVSPLFLAFSGCFGTSTDKGDNVGSRFAPKATSVEDANTAGSMKTPLPKGENTSEPIPK